MHESAERAVSAARRLGDAPLTAAALAMLALADSMTGAAERAEVRPLGGDGACSSPSRTPSLPATSRPRARLAGVELYLDRYAEADAHASRALAVARATGQGEHVLVLVQILGRRVAPARASWPRPASCSTVGSRPRACWATPTRSCGAFPAVPPPRCGWATWSSRSRPRRRASTSARTPARASTRPRQPPTSPRRFSRRANRNARSSCCSAPRAARSWCSSPGAREPVSSRCSRAAGSRSTASAEARRAAVCAEAWASAVRLPMAVAWAGRAAAAVDLHAGDPSRAAERALASAAAADEVGAPVEAALSRTLAGRALAASRRA